MSERDRLHLTFAYADITTAAAFYIPVPEGGDVKKITTCVGSATTGALAVTAKIGGVAVTGGVVTVATGSAAGVVDEAEPTALYSIPVDGSLELEFDGTPSGGTTIVVHVEIERNA